MIRLNFGDWEFSARIFRDRRAELAGHLGLYGGLAAGFRFLDTQFLPANALTEKVWSPTFFEYTLANMFFSKFTGTGAGSIIQLDKNLTKQPGDQVTFRLRMPLQTAGGYDDSDLEGAEEAMDFMNFPVAVHERGNGVRAKGKMTMQYTQIDIIREATEALGDWHAEQLDNDCLYALSGVGNQGTYAGEGSSDIKTVNEHAPSAARIYRGGGDSEGTLSTPVATDAELGDGASDDYLNYLFCLQLISIAKRKATMAAPKFRPIRINGRKLYVMLLHPYQVKALRNQIGEQSFTAIHAAAGIRGVENPLFQRMLDDAIGIYDDVILYEYDRILCRKAAEVFDDSDPVDDGMDAAGGVARALFLGAQAGAIAYAQMPKKYQKDFDYNRKPGTAVDMIYGVSKTVFRDPGVEQAENNPMEDFACICVDTCYEED